MKKYDAFIFDLDGTLWYACDAIAKGWNETFAYFSIPQIVTAKDIESVAGHPFHLCTSVLLPDLNLNLYPNFIDKLGEFEKKHMELQGGKLYPDVKESLKLLKANHSLFIVSNCSAWYLDMFLNIPDLRSVFDDYNCFGLSSLPKGQMIKNMVEKHALKNPVYIGDTAGDEKASIEANISFIHAQYGYGKPKGNYPSVSKFVELVTMPASSC